MFIEPHSTSMLLHSGTSFLNLLGITSRQLERLHDFVIVWLIMILGVVLIVFSFVYYKGYSEERQESSVLERIWTLIPMIILTSIAIPRIYLLCTQDAFLRAPSTSVKVLSRQWRWQREQFDIEEDHLLDVDEVCDRGSFTSPRVLRMRLTRLILTRTDVLHSLGVPELGVKLDSVPGRLNSTILEINRVGIYPGGCYELCGAGHRAMPISLLVTR